MNDILLATQLMKDLMESLVPGTKFENLFADYFYVC